MHAAAQVQRLGIERGQGASDRCPGCGCRQFVGRGAEHLAIGAERKAQISVGIGHIEVGDRFRHDARPARTAHAGPELIAAPVRPQGGFGCPLVSAFVARQLFGAQRDGAAFLGQAQRQAVGHRAEPAGQHLRRRGFQIAQHRRCQLRRRFVLQVGGKAMDAAGVPVHAPPIRREVDAQPQPLVVQHRRGHRLRHGGAEDGAAIEAALPLEQVARGAVQRTGRIGHAQVQVVGRPVGGADLQVARARRGVTAPPWATPVSAMPSGRKSVAARWSAQDSPLSVSISTTHRM